MDCLELRIPPLPKLTTVGHTVWKPGMIHFRRSFAVYDMLLVRRGTLFMAEDGTEYPLSEGHVLVLEPGRTHWGYRPCETETEIYWLHFAHEPAVRTLAHTEIAWPFRLRKGTDRDLQPPEQFMYLPKSGRIDLRPLIPLLDEMCECHERFTLETALPLHERFVRVLAVLQAAVRPKTASRAATLAQALTEVLEEQAREGEFDAKQLQERLHFRFDYLACCLKRHTGMTPLKYFRHLQVERAKRLLERTDLTVREVAAEVGVDSYNYFIRLFRKETGVPPARYRELRRAFA